MDSTVREVNVIPAEVFPVGRDVSVSPHSPDLDDEPLLEIHGREFSDVE